MACTNYHTTINERQMKKDSMKNMYTLAGFTLNKNQQNLLLGGCCEGDDPELPVPPDPPAYLNNSTVTNGN